MTETTTAATKVKTTKHSASSFSLPDYGIPKFDVPNMELPEAFREMAEQGVAHAKDTYAQAKVASDQVGDLLQNTYVTIAQGVIDYNLKLFEIVRTNTDAVFDCAHELLGVKSPSQLFEQSTALMRRQFDIGSAQNKELCALAQKVAIKTAEPLKTGLSKAFNKVT